MKYFSLLSGEEVHPVPGRKVIPAKEFSTLKEASEILVTVQREAEEFKRKVAEEAEMQKELAFQEGFQEGLASLNQHLLFLDRELKQIREEVQKKLLPIALKADRKSVV